jgi:phosphoribosyl-AMP cyclohydrolase
VPVITQSAISGKVLMLAWMNQDALTQTLESGQAVYFSRSRNEIWIKGLTSGNTQAVKEIRLDCDADAVLLSVEEAGPACHTGDESCFDADLLKRFE